MQRPNRSSTVMCVEVDSLVVLKIIRHSEQEKQLIAGDVVQGHLTGLVCPGDNGQKRLEITNCFSILRGRVDDDDGAHGME